MDPVSTGKIKPMLTLASPSRRLYSVLAQSGDALAALAFGTNIRGPSNARLWPESDEDRVIRVKMEERHRIEEDEKLKREEFESRQAEALKEQQQGRGCQE